ncbi:hypothetical protein [Cronobacter phage Dev_CS701]|jgi:DNA-binding ferritin-like protein|uniref:Uncharacterized protein n=5 Tax=root TaxID=1 RepID=A0A0M4QW66_9CAUD|nr:starvation-inducible transcriptional regulator [Cronobacter phage vB_CsaM_GAP161]YP_009194954.1 starvation-inducible transcriptional regulator [Citrobacter phage Margaery]AYJ72998.1 hypothetical protein CPT_Maroon_135 [Citrobacter phage Maroon]QPX73492.1 hypothetical protein [Cronobacter phage vB_CsaM_Cronuts]QPX76488.1 hypothetical protein [Cronobacter phage vB_CsaM_SemperBestia]UGO54597.1 hypothetical protein BANACH_216 [Cronobacter phage vB_CsaD_Banach]UGV22957.1 hypothetical protein IN
MQTFNEVTERDTASKIDAFIGTCLMSVTYMHSAHFATGSYSQHKAFEGFYEDMQDLVDKFTEIHIGITGRYKPVLKTENVLDTVAYLRKIADEANEIYDSVDSSLKNVLDEIKGLCYQTIYKLTKLS